MTDPDPKTQFTQPGRADQRRRLRKGPAVTGILLVLLGIMLLSAQLVGRSLMSQFWPLLFIGGGLIFFAVYYFRTDKTPGTEGLLFPGSYLLILGFLFLLLNIIGWNNMRYLWPTFVFGIAIGLASMYYLAPDRNKKQRKDLRSSINVISLISLVLYLIAIIGIRLWPLGLVAIGVLIIYKTMSAKNRKEPDSSTSDFESH